MSFIIPTTLHPKRIMKFIKNIFSILKFMTFACSDALQSSIIKEFVFTGKLFKLLSGDVCESNLERLSFSTIKYCNKVIASTCVAYICLMHRISSNVQHWNCSPYVPYTSQNGFLHVSFFDVVRTNHRTLSNSSVHFTLRASSFFFNPLKIIFFHHLLLSIHLGMFHWGVTMLDF